MLRIIKTKKKKIIYKIEIPIGILYDYIKKQKLQIKITWIKIINLQLLSFIFRVAKRLYKHDIIFM